MFFKILGTLALLCHFVIAVECSGLNAHVHGEAQANMLIEKDLIVLEISFPAGEVLDFEHTQLSEKERKLVRDAEIRLEKANYFSFFSKTPWLKRKKMIKVAILQKNAKWQAEGHSADSDQSESHLDTHKHHDEKHQHNTETQAVSNHANFYLKYHYKIESNTNVLGLETTLFDELQSLNEINLKVLSDDFQAEYELTPESKKIFFK